MNVLNCSFGSEPKSHITIDGQEKVPFDEAIRILIQMEQSERIRALTSGDAEFLKPFGVVVVCGIGAEIIFIGTKKEFEARNLALVGSSLPDPKPRWRG